MKYVAATERSLISNETVLPVNGDITATARCHIASINSVEVPPRTTVQRDHQLLSNLVTFGIGTIARSARLIFSKFWQVPCRFWAHLRHEMRVRKAIAELDQLDDQLLRDIGIIRSEIERIVRDELTNV